MFSNVTINLSFPVTLWVWTAITEPGWQVTRLGGVLYFAVPGLVRSRQSPAFPRMDAVASFERQRSSRWWFVCRLGGGRQSWIRTLLHRSPLVPLKHKWTHYYKLNSDDEQTQTVTSSFCILVSLAAVEVLTPPSLLPKLVVERSPCHRPFPPVQEPCLRLRQETKPGQFLLGILWEK